MAIETQPPNLDKAPTSAQLNGAPPGAGPTNPRNRTWHEWMATAVVVTAVLALVAIIASVVALASRSASTTTVIKQVSSPSKRAASNGALTTAQLGSGAVQSGAGAVVPIVLQLDDTKGIPGTITNQPSWPRYSPSRIAVPAGKKVTLVITNYDDAATPLTAGTPYNKVLGGQETVNGKPVTFVGNKTIAHTLTVAGLGINVPIPMAAGGGPSTITFTFTAKKAGTYTWQCYSPCGTGTTGTGGPMTTQGYMQGTFVVS